MAGKLAKLPSIVFQTISNPGIAKYYSSLEKFLEKFPESRIEIEPSWMITQPTIIYLKFEK